MGGNVMSSKVIRVGDQVKIDFGGSILFGKVSEDRGPIGVGGRRLYGITFDAGADEPFYIELPVDEFEVIKPKKEKA